MDFVINQRRMAADVDPAGSGVPCVLLHPFPLDRRYFAHVVPRLAGRARCITPDARGFGGSASEAPFSIADLADDVAALLDALKIERAVIGGVSMGGYAALAFAARHPRRLLGLILADTRAGADSPEGRAKRDANIALVQRDGVDPFIDAQVPHLVSSGAPEALRAEVRRIGRAQPPDAVVAALEALRDRPDRQGELPHITCPTLVIVGTEDTVTPPSEAAAMATAIPRAVLVELPGVGHLGSLESPGPFAQAVGGFVGNIKAAAKSTAS